MGFVIYVDTNCKITRPNGQTRDICEVVILEQSSEQIMIVTVWEDHAIEECRGIQAIAACFPVIGFTALRLTHRKGFSLAFTPKTSINLDPQCKDADELRSWSETNHELLDDKSYQVFQVRQPNQARNIITAEQLLKKKAKDTL
ncbi:uncharacterized protein LOC141608144 [Silene latifolia]|uniref:uncharacterized protein LOC141608144 n=1 Tax=Silene latifolia TaxID=37657 RepID=UPI003D77AC67